MDQRSTLRFPGATHLCVSFDPRCATQGAGLLELRARCSDASLGEKAFQQVAVVRLQGRRGRWPSRPLVLPGSTLELRFRTDAFETEFGYRCTVRGLLLRYSSHPLYRSFRAVSHSLSAALSAQLAGSPRSAAEQRWSALCASPLLCSGLALPDEQPKLEQAFLGDLVSGAEHSQAMVLYRHADRLRRRTPMDHLGGAPLEPARRAFVAALLRLSGLVCLAMKSAHSLASASEDGAAKFQLPEVDSGVRVFCVFCVLCFFFVVSALCIS
jgi:hypothetical protein